MAQFDTEIIDHVTWNDDDKKVTASILDMVKKGADVVVCTGGMSVDPDDKTPLAIKKYRSQGGILRGPVAREPCFY